ncbi:hypothetical protein PU629_07065 [Pullulanibacillus sp. KACC 23026]|uniref:hypothetical protein n=1 Tax=Pullulanibacillus sp. KACC 23026 TaxID=3028315 RepID=UPI0023B01BBE|nr:hypothetical protein [Pullulanibacillus sp. KACC 23026]WEG14119.1 hypothetical protein PU629_07065 [Pullulanibacillus sp. KACC 23026]
MTINVLYKDYGQKGGEEMLSTDNFAAWSEDGNYTLFFDDISTDSLSLIIPTANVCWIKVVKE